MLNTLISLQAMLPIFVGVRNHVKCKVPVETPQIAHTDIFGHFKLLCMQYDLYGDIK